MVHSLEVQRSPVLMAGRSQSPPTGPSHENSARQGLTCRRARQSHIPAIQLRVKPGTTYFCPVVLRWWEGWLFLGLSKRIHWRQPPIQCTTTTLQHDGNARSGLCLPWMGPPSLLLPVPPQFLVGRRSDCLTLRTWYRLKRRQCARKLTSR